MRTNVGSVAALDPFAGQVRLQTPDPAAVAAAYAYCREVTRTHAKSFYFCTQTLPRHKRPAIYAIYALCRQIDDLVDTNRHASPMDVTLAVDAWSQALRDLYAARPFPAHPVLIAWYDFLPHFPVRLEHPLELMQGCLMDARTEGPVRFERFDDLYTYAYRVASLVGLMTSEVFGYGDPSALQYAVALGIAFQLTNILRDVGEDARRNRIYLPLEDLRRFGCTEEMILQGRLTPEVVALLKFEICRARDFYREAECGIRLLSPDSRFTVFLSSRLYGGILRDIERHGYDVFSRRAHLSLGAKLWAVPPLWVRARLGGILT
ncbi:squalene/phytoene synthase family protein [Chloracidobacterium aggregatum]|uniref:Squalene/phytoene synthase family protein n=1 Tax=Chloracidobacterium sp. N TaxID=2821540 RepID=A0ABX8AW77_9BACT|nr:squalene/phytoene synthase family protein [Chloracidobacterium aggregatum]QUV84691.1 squalene/phytoene synthase family protein [Chloracidobacterium sp. 2]QUV86806.1 squalene/phytoene synthase family protein [Chloracidobacterium sp. S]QUV91804.1 squalene/phytoene synthase family protein [Chloracidobacterium sp. A]QUV92937.1 squalene/phytoene synthase family protein [Chloracidobacterium sp. N]QUV96091.1 squalene/phytoene synthase family protein [Chloracidobacterium sp. E]